MTCASNTSGSQHMLRRNWRRQESTIAPWALIHQHMLPYRTLNLMGKSCMGSELHIRFKRHATLMVRINIIVRAYKRPIAHFALHLHLRIKPLISQVRRPQHGRITHHKAALQHRIPREQAQVAPLDVVDQPREVLGVLRPLLHVLPDLRSPWSGLLLQLPRVHLHRPVNTLGTLCLDRAEVRRQNLHMPRRVHRPLLVAS